MIKKVEDRQSLLDIALEVYGSAESAFALCIENDALMTEELTAEQELTYTAANVASKSVTNHYAVYNIKPATDICMDDELTGRIFDNTFDNFFN
jgi:hypothetical protein